MASAYQLGQFARREGLTAEQAVVEHLRRDMKAEELREALASFLNGYGVKENPARKTLFDRCVQAVRARGGARDPRAVCATAGRKKLGQAEMTRRSVAGRKNPAGAAAEGFEDFHGYAPTQSVKVTRRVHFHKFLSGAGELVSLVVLGVDNATHTIKDFGGALLAFNEKRNQLFIEGGDQSLNLDNFGITEPHELETIGKVKKIGYETVKTHLGADGGHAVFVHTFRTTNENGRHVTVTINRYPDLIYRVLEQQFEFSGGSYTIRREGIDN